MILNEKKKKKRRKEKKKKRRGKGYVRNRTQDLRRSGSKLCHEEHTGRTIEIVLLKRLSLIKREFKDIFQTNDCSFDSENPT